MALGLREDTPNPKFTLQNPPNAQLLLVLGGLKAKGRCGGAPQSSGTRRRGAHRFTVRCEDEDKAVVTNERQRLDLLDDAEEKAPVRHHPRAAIESAVPFEPVVLEVRPDGLGLDVGLPVASWSGRRRRRRGRQKHVVVAAAAAAAAVVVVAVSGAESVGCRCGQFWECR
jgi:hypothetical protein